MFVALVLLAENTSARPRPRPTGKKSSIRPNPTTKTSIIDQEQRTGKTTEEIGTFKPSTAVNGNEVTTTLKSKEVTTEPSTVTETTTTEKPKEETTKSPNEGTSETSISSVPNIIKVEAASPAIESSGIRIAGELNGKEIKKISGSIGGNLKPNETAPFNGEMFKEEKLSFSLDVSGGLLSPLLMGLASSLMQGNKEVLKTVTGN